MPKHGYTHESRFILGTQLAASISFFVAVEFPYNDTNFSQCSLQHDELVNHGNQADQFIRLCFAIPGGRNAAALRLPAGRPQHSSNQIRPTGVKRLAVP